MEFGKVTKMTNEKYHSKEMQGFISKGDLDLINKAPYIYKDKLDGKYKVEVTDAMALGSFFHTLVLEPELAVDYISDKKAVAYGSRATKAYKEALEGLKTQNPGKTIIKAEDYKTCEIMLEALRDNKLACSLLSNGIAEQTYLWNSNGTPCKCRPDYLVEFNDKLLAIDIKTTKDAKQFERAIANFRYHVQAGHYTEGIQEIEGREVMFIFIVQEKEYPFGNRIIALNDMTLELGVKARLENLNTLRKCQETSHWPKYEKTDKPEIEIVDVPNWAFYNFEFDRK